MVQLPSPIHSTTAVCYTASLKLAAEVMKHPHPGNPSVLFKPGDLVWLEGTNINTTHPKAKLAPKCHGPFKVLLATWGVNCKFQLPTTWRIHPVFHNPLLSPYKETTAHGPNYSGSNNCPNVWPFWKDWLGINQVNYIII